MKLKHIEEIASTAKSFMRKVINKNESVEYDTLVERIREYCANYTEHGDDTIDIDYRYMCFTVHMNQESGKWQLCENASYYIYQNGFLDYDEGIIDVELF